MNTNNWMLSAILGCWAMYLERKEEFSWHRFFLRSTSVVYNFTSVHLPPEQQFGDLGYARPGARTAKGAGREGGGQSCPPRLGDSYDAVSLGCLLSWVCAQLLPIVEIQVHSFLPLFPCIINHHHSASLYCQSPYRSSVAMLSISRRAVSPTQTLFPQFRLQGVSEMWTQFQAVRASNWFHLFETLCAPQWFVASWIYQWRSNSVRGGLLTTGSGDILIHAHPWTASLSCVISRNWNGASANDNSAIARHLLQC